jgi:hypothetical protein
VWRYLRKIIKKSILGQPVAFTDFFGYLVGEQLLIGVRFFLTNIIYYLLTIKIRRKKNISPPFILFGSYYNMKP